jgi:thioredoxin reductase (NADPH)
MVRDVVIVGAGPAGISAAVYLKRIGIEPLVLEKDRIGGLLLNANLVENYPGFPEGITGENLVDLLKKQLKRWDVKVKQSEVDKIVPMSHGFNLITSDGEVEAKTVVLATGTRPTEAGISGENGYKDKHLFYEVRDIPRDNGAEYVIVGSGDAAFDYALNLSKNAHKIDIVYRSSEPKCIGLLLERVKETPNITLHPNTEPDILIEDNGKMKLSCNTPEGNADFEADYILIACGREPNSVEVEGLGHVSESRFPGLHVVGDVKRGKYRQVSIAVGDGVHAAMAIADYLVRGEEK